MSLPERVPTAPGGTLVNPVIEHVVEHLVEHGVEHGVGGPAAPHDRWLAGPTVPARAR